MSTASSFSSTSSHSFSRVKWVVFDWHDTLWTRPLTPVEAVRKIALIYGVEVPYHDHALHALFHQQALDPVHLIFKDHPEAQAELMHALAMARQVRVGVFDMMASLHQQGVQCAIATSSAMGQVMPVLSAMGLDQYVRAVFSGDDYPSKPNTAMLDALADRYEVSAHTVLMVGDHLCDMQMAQAWGCQGIAVLTGTTPFSVLQSASPLAILHSVDHLLALWAK